MAVDFFVMPFSKYIAGDFVTPIMQYAWDSGIPYAVHTSHGRRQLPPGVPMGGHTAPRVRAKIQRSVANDLRGLGELLSQGVWDEAANFEGRFYRIRHREYAALLELAIDRRRGFFGLWKERGLHEIGAGAFLPQYFEGVREMEEPLATTYASAPFVLERLQSAAMADEHVSVPDTFIAALRAVVETKFPMVVDS